MAGAVRKLVHAVALEEAALAHLLSAEADKSQRAAAALPPPRSFHDVLSMQRNLCDLLQAVIRKEEILLRKLDMAIHLGLRDD